MDLNLPEKTKPAVRRLPWLVLMAALLSAAAGGAWYYHRSGRMQLEGVLQSNLRTLVAERGGQVMEVAVPPGARARAGDPLIRFDEAAARSALLQGERQLQALAMLVPPQLLRAPLPDGGDENLTEGLERRRAAEEAARQRLQEATDREARSAVLHSRASTLAARGKLTRQELENAQAHLDAAREEVRKARQSFENLSLERATAGAEIRRIRDMQAAAGADGVSGEVRLRRFEQQQAQVAELRAALAAAVIRAPADGLVVDVAVHPGDRTAAMQPCVLFRPDGRGPQARALVPENEARRLTPGQQCRVRLAGTEDSDFEGVIMALRPGLPASAPPGEGTGESLTAVWIGLFSRERDGEPPALPEDGARVEISVLLRAPLLNPAAYAGSAGTPLAEPESAAPAFGQPFADAPVPAAPGGGPLSVQTPFGGEALPQQLLQEPRPVPALKSGSPEALGRPAPDAAAPEPLRAEPELPPMRAPRQLTGSSLPDPGNNPSLVPPALLDPESRDKP